MSRSLSSSSPTRSPEYAKRIERLARRIRPLGVDVFFVETPVNRYYLTGFASSNGLLALTPEGEADFLTDFRYLEEARRAIPEARVAALPQRGATLEPLAGRRGWRRIGYEGSIAARRLDALKEQLPDVRRWRDCEEALRALRSVKSRDEQTLLRRAARLGDEVFARAVAEAEPGMPERDLRRLLRYWADRLGAEGLSFDCIVATGAHSSKVHTTAGDTQLRRGRPLLIDMGVVREHYCSDMTRALCVGGQSDKMHEIYQIVRTAQQKALDAVRAGRPCSVVDAAARDYIERRGYGRRFGHGTGHGVGLEIHEAPSLWQGSKELLRAGMVITVEPGIYLPGIGGVRIEDTVIVRPQGCEILNRTPKELIVIET